MQSRERREERRHRHTRHQGEERGDLAGEVEEASFLDESERLEEDHFDALPDHEVDEHYQADSRGIVKDFTGLGPTEGQRGLLVSAANPQNRCLD